MQQHANQRAPFPPLTVNTPLALLGYQACSLYGQLDPRIAQIDPIDPVLLYQLLVKMLYVQVVVLLRTAPETASEPLPPPPEEHAVRSAAPGDGPAARRNPSSRSATTACACAEHSDPLSQLPETT